MKPLFITGIFPPDIGGPATYGALLHAVNHSVCKAGLFLLSGNVLREFATTQAGAVRGVWRRLPLPIANLLGPRVIRFPVSPVRALPLPGRLARILQQRSPRPSFLDRDRFAWPPTGLIAHSNSGGAV